MFAVQFRVHLYSKDLIKIVKCLLPRLEVVSHLRQKHLHPFADCDALGLKRGDIVILVNLLNHIVDLLGLLLAHVFRHYVEDSVHQLHKLLVGVQCIPVLFQKLGKFLGVVQNVEDCLNVKQILKVSRSALLWIDDRVLQRRLFLFLRARIDFAL